MTTCNHPLAPGSLLRCVRDVGHEHGCVYEASECPDRHSVSEGRAEQ